MKIIRILFSLFVLLLVTSPVWADVNIKYYGAKCDGVTDDSAAFTAAMNYINANTGIIRLPAGICVVNVPLVFSNGNTGIIGAGHRTSVIQTSLAAMPQIQITAAIGDQKFVDLERFELNRTVVASIGGDGIQANSNLSDPVNIILRDLYIFREYNGVTLGPGIGMIDNVVIQDDQNDGILMTNSGSAPNVSFGYSLNWITADFNGNNGVEVITASTGDTNPASIGVWSHIVTFANCSDGLVLNGSSNKQIGNLALTNSTFQADNGLGEVVISSFDTTTLHKRLTAVTMTDGGTGSCGPNYPGGPAASHNTSGLYIRNTTQLVVDSSVVVGNAGNGIDLNGAQGPISLTGIGIYNNGIGHQAGFLDGVLYTGVTDYFTISGGYINGNQGYGIDYVPTNGSLYVTGTTCRNNVVSNHIGPITFTTSACP